jgi:hypothetical protein
VADDVMNDRTHKATLDGSLRLVYWNANFPEDIAREYPVCQRDPDERRVLNVQVCILMEPWSDVGYGPRARGAGNGVFDYQDLDHNGRHDAGEPCEPFIDISAGAVAFAAVGSRGAIWTIAEIDREMAYFSCYLASSSIRVRERPRRFLDPAENLFNQQLATRGLFDEFPDDDPGVPPIPSRDEMVIQGNFRSPENLNATEDDDVIDIYFLAPFSSRRYGIQYRPAFVAAQHLNVQLINQVYIGLYSSSDNVPFATAHEGAHQLTNQPDFLNSPGYIYFPTFGAGPGDGTIWTSKRRITDAVSGNARTQRAPWALHAIGNRLLRRP